MDAEFEQTVRQHGGRRIHRKRTGLPLVILHAEILAENRHWADAVAAAAGCSVGEAVDRILARDRKRAEKLREKALEASKYKTQNTAP